MPTIAGCIQRRAGDGASRIAIACDSFLPLTSSGISIAEIRRPPITCCRFGSKHDTGAVWAFLGSTASPTVFASLDEMQVSDAPSSCGLFDYVVHGVSSVLRWEFADRGSDSDDEGAAFSDLQRSASIDGEVLVVLPGGVFLIQPDLEVKEIGHPFFAIGDGAVPAMAAMFAISKASPRSGSDKILKSALTAASNTVSCVQSPFHLMSLRRPFSDWAELVICGDSSR